MRELSGRGTLGTVNALTILAASAALIPTPPVLKYQRGQPEGVNPLGVACYEPATDTIYFDGPMLHRSVRAHETGHAFDDQILTAGDRVYFQRLMHAPAGPWDPEGDGTNSPSEWFAEYYAAAAMNHDPRVEANVAYVQPGPKRLVRFRKALVRLAARRGITDTFE